MNISSNTAVSTNIISEIPETSLEDFPGRAVNLIQDHALLVGVGCVTTIALGTFCYFRSKKSTVDTSPKNTPENVTVKVHTIIKSRLNLPSLNESEFNRVTYTQEKILDTRDLKNVQILLPQLIIPNDFPIKVPQHIDTEAKGIRHSFCIEPLPKKIKGPFSNADEAIKATCDNVTSQISITLFQYNKVANYTKHSVRVDNSGSIFLDGFMIADKIFEGIPSALLSLNAEQIYLLAFKNRPDLICIQNSKKEAPEKLIVLEYVKEKEYILSWIADANDYADENEKKTFEFSIKKIDNAIQARNIFPLILFSHKKDINSAFANLPKDILNYIAMLQITL